MRDPQINRASASEIKQPVVFDVDGSGKWNECLACHEPALFVTSDTCEAIITAGLTGFVALNAEIRDIESKALSRTPPPRFHCLMITSHIDVDPERLYNSNVTSNRSVLIHQTVPTLDSWDGSDFFLIGNRLTAWVFCSRRVVELARDLNWRQLAFVPMDLPRTLHFDYIQTARHADSPWPPKWYPDGFTPTPENLEWLNDYPDPRKARKASATSTTPKEPQAAPKSAPQLSVPVVAMECPSCNDSWNLSADSMADRLSCPQCGSPFEVDPLKLALAHRWLPPREHPLCGILYPVSPLGWESRWEVSAGGRRKLPVECGFDRWPDDAQARTFAAIKERFDGVWKKARPMLLEAVGLHDPEAAINADNATLSIEIPEEPLGPETIWTLGLTLEEPDLSWFLDIRDWKPIPGSVVGAD